MHTPAFKPLRLLAIVVVGLCLSAVHGALRPLPERNKNAPAAPRAVPTTGADQNMPVAATDTAGTELDAATIDGWNREGTVQLVDARLPEEFAAGHMPFSYNLPLAAFMGGTPRAVIEMDPEMRTVVYCGGGDCDASKKVREMLLSFGFKDVLVYEEGWPGWLAYGGEVRTGEGQ